VTKKGVEVGNFVAPQTPLCALVPNKNAWIVANYKESQINKIKKGEEVEIEIDAYDGIRLKGVVDSIQYGTGEVFSLFPPQNASGNWIKVTQRIPVKILFKEKPDVPLRVGMSTKVVVLAK
jgi:membrane fusion protein (multidrug efflux system)